MGVINQLRERFSALSPSLQQVARYVLDHPNEVVTQSMRSVGQSSSTRWLRCAINARANAISAASLMARGLMSAICLFSAAGSSAENRTPILRISSLRISLAMATSCPDEGGEIWKTSIRERNAPGI